MNTRNRSRIRTLHDARAVAHSLLRVTGLLERRDHPHIARLVCQRWRWGRGESDERGVLVALLESATTIATHGMVRERPIVYAHAALTNRERQFALAVALGFAFLNRTRIPLGIHRNLWANRFAEELTGLREDDVFPADHPLCRWTAAVRDALDRVVRPLQAFDRWPAAASLTWGAFSIRELREHIARLMAEEPEGELRDRMRALAALLEEAHVSADMETRDAA